MFRFRGGKWKSMRVIEGSEDTRTRGSRQSDYDNANNEVQQSRPMNHGDEVSLDAQ